MVAARPPMTKTKNRRSSPSHALLSLTRRPQLYTTNFRKVSLGSRPQLCTTNFRKVSPWKQPTARRESKSKKKKRQHSSISAPRLSPVLYTADIRRPTCSPPKTTTPAPSKRRRSRNREIEREREKQVTQRLTLGDDDDQGNSMSYMQPINLRAATNAQPGDHDPQQTYYCQYE